MFIAMSRCQLPSGAEDAARRGRLSRGSHAVRPATRW